jgi:NifU-like protein involved in Fe-S cluster formation
MYMCVCDVIFLRPSQNADIASHLKLPPVKLHCSMLAEDAIKAAVANFKSKQTDAPAPAAAAANGKAASASA